MKMKKANIYRSGSKDYYKDALTCIFHMCILYDGYESKKGLKSLVDDVREFAKDALNDKELYFIKGDNQHDENDKEGNGNDK